MRNITHILNYEIHWRDKSKSGFIGELFFVVKNNSGGSLSTPVGHLIGFIEPPSEYSTSYWKILLTIREEIRYNELNNTTYVFVKSAYANKLRYYAERLIEFKRIYFDMKLSNSFSGALRTFAYFMASGSQYTLEGVDYLSLYGNEPSAIEQVFAIYANVLELDDTGNVLNAKYAEKRATDYLRAYCDSSFNVDPPFEDWEVALHGPPPLKDKG